LFIKRDPQNTIEHLLLLVTPDVWQKQQPFTFAFDSGIITTVVQSYLPGAAACKAWW